MTNSKKKLNKTKPEHKMEVATNANRWRNNIIIALILTYTLFLFSKAINYQFINYDDDYYIINNLLIRNLSFEGLKNILNTPVIGMYNPLTFLIYALEYKFWGLNPKAYHISNIIFHLLATITIYNFIFKLTKRYETATIVALLFAIHPMHVSVVTWVSQTKTSLFAVFYFLALGSYLNYIDRNYKTKYLVGATLLFILSTLSKPSAVTLAPMLFLLDYYRSRKLDKRLMVEKTPFFLIAFFFGIITLLSHAEAKDSIFDVNMSYSLINNLLISNYSIVFYINKLFVPLNLSTIYPYPDNETFLPLQYYFSIPIIPLIFWLIYKSGRFKKEIIFGILFFVIAISILIRIVPSGNFRAANQYTYLSYTGLFFIIGQYFTYLLDNKFSYSKKIKYYFGGLLIIGLCFFTYRTTAGIRVWENSITLFDDIIHKQPKLAICYYNRGIAKEDSHDLAGAMQDYTKAIECDPKHIGAYNNRGEIKRSLRDFDGALEDYRMAKSLDSNNYMPYHNIGIIFFEQRKFEEALKNYNISLQLNPNNASAFHNRANTRISLGDTAGALEDWRKAATMGFTLSLTPLKAFSPHWDSIAGYTK